MTELAAVVVSLDPCSLVYLMVAVAVTGAWLARNQ